MDIVFQDGANFVVVTCDAVTEERHGLHAVMTEFPVERDADRSDHHRAVVDDFSLDVVITDTPTTGTADSLEFRTREAWLTLEDARDRHLPAVIVTELKTYGEDTDLLLKEAVTTRTNKDRTWIRASLTFGQMRTFSTELVDDPTPTRPRDQHTTDIGSQSTTEASSEQLTSLLANPATAPLLASLLGGG
jgi:hypothetical protein